MLKLLRQLLWWLKGGTLNLLFLAIGLLLVWGIFSPVGTLVWWLQQEPGSLGLKRDRDVDNSTNSAEINAETETARSPNTIRCYVIFLTGVGDFSANQLTGGEEFFLQQLDQQHPNCTIVSDVFPYSAANEGLGGQRWLAPLWRFAEEADGWLKNADILIKIRNIWRFAISIDNRYGPVYNQGIASAIVERMEAVRPLHEGGDRSPLHVILIGTSGGAQVALGSAPYLDQWLQAQITVVSVGGVFSGTDGLLSIDHLYHLQGQQDWVDNVGSIVFPSRWSWVVGSPFNQLVRQGRMTVKAIGPQAHDGETGYFGEDSIGNSNTTYVQQTLEAVNQLPIWFPSNR
jgi:hypothetical protein